METYKDIEEAQSEMQQSHEDLFKEFKIKIPKPEYFRQKLDSFDLNDKLQDMQEEIEELKKKMAELERSFKSRSAPVEDPPDKTDPDTMEEQI